MGSQAAPVVRAESSAWEREGDTSFMRAPPRWPTFLLLLILLLLLFCCSLVARAAEFTASFPQQRACSPRSSVVVSGSTATRVEVTCTSDGTAVTTFTAISPVSTTATTSTARQLAKETVASQEPTSSAAQLLVRAKDEEGSCTIGGNASCGDFQRCVAVDNYGVERMCADYCDPRRCSLGFSCRLEPTQACSSSSAGPCPPLVAVCIAPDIK